MTAMAGSLHRLIRLCVAKLPLISADGVNRVAKDCRDLQSLDLTRCGAVESQALRVGLFQFGSSLRSLNLSALSSSGTDADIELLVTNCLLLEELSLERWSRLTDRAVIVIGGRLRNLERLNLTFLHRITSDGLRQFARLCSRRLFELFLGKCSNITNEGIIQLSQNTPQLRRIYLAGCRVITDEAILQLIQCCSQLEVLSVPGCSITDVTVVAAAKHLHQTLNVAQFSFCPDVSPMAICRLAHACRRLEILQLVQCRRVLDSFVLEYSQPCPVHLLSRYEGIYCAIRPPNIRRLGLRYLASQRTYTI
jgi:F-box and leucine-rich repeat protein GRR1